MDSLPLDLVKLCALASLAECGDQLWDSVPSLGLWAALWMPVKRRWKGWREAPLDILRGAVPAQSQPAV